MKILVTGGAGFIGSHLVQFLLGKGYDIIVVDNFHTGTFENLREFKDEIEFINKSCGEISKREIGEIDSIFHLGIYSSSPLYRENPNLVGRAVNDFLNMLILSRAYNIRMVWASTSSIYNGNPTPWKENMPIYVKDYYTEARYCMERLARLHHDWYGTETLGMRLFSIYGKKEENKGKYASIVSQVLWCIKEGRSPLIYGDGTQSRDFVYVDDITEGLLLALESNIEYGILNLGTGRSCNFNELVKMINRILGADIEPNYVENPIKGYVHETLADTSTSQKLLGFNAHVHLIDGIKKLVNNI
ncbi:MAG: NAD-dependent epimerase/dehydratase family protein [Theionarchaea archaeon]|nr:NAD-dependent epimerase/dehydratase family protein [Theionarchaea archaeon]